jgi:putative toxin-antitoxin system antitoxin component (TIGR02293 family)
MGSPELPVPSFPEVLKQKHSAFLSEVYETKIPEAKKAFDATIQRWIELQEPNDPLEVVEVLVAAEQAARTILSEIAAVPNMGGGGVAEGISKVSLAVRALQAAEERVARVFVSLVIRGENEEEAAKSLRISRGEVRDAWRDAKRLIAESRKREALTAQALENAASATKGNLPAIVERATEVIGDHQEAMRWLGTPVRGLDYATPISLLGTKKGTERVIDILGQIEHGVW